VESQPAIQAAADGTRAESSDARTAKMTDGPESPGKDARGAKKYKKTQASDKNWSWPSQQRMGARHRQELGVVFSSRALILSTGLGASRWEKRSLLHPNAACCSRFGGAASAGRLALGTNRASRVAVCV
jgi:hypothetical protein